MFDLKNESEEVLPDFIQTALADSTPQTQLQRIEATQMRDMAWVIAQPNTVFLPTQHPHRFNLAWLRLMLLMGAVVALFGALFTLAALILAGTLPRGEQIVYMVSMPMSFDPNSVNAPSGQGNFDIFLLDVPRRVSINLTNTPGSSDRYPVWSPDGGEIAFHSDRGGNWDIYVMDDRGENLRQLTNDVRWDAMPAWSPDGTQIAFHSDRGGTWDVYVMDAANGSNQRAAFKQDFDELWPDWSPDGTQLLYTYDQEDTTRQSMHLYIYDLNSREVTQITLADDTQASFPEWSPMGDMIAYSSSVYGDSDILLLDLETRAITNLTPPQSPTSYVNEYNPMWSPDGSQLMFVAVEDGAWGLYLINSDGSGRQRLIAADSEIGAPDWRP